ncbi:hypothetical protein E4U23_004033 [Claviceps purpurea]|nr:hypothetical protein E4U23_004033 [Claviceps purpurea]
MARGLHGDLFNKPTGRVSRGAGKEIDEWRHRTKILSPKLIPVAKVCLQDRPQTVAAQEDKAPAHAHPIQQHLYDSHEISRLLWPGNSPGLNMIEPAWTYLKRAMAKKGAQKNRQETVAAWEAAWKDLSQEQIRA